MTTRENILKLATECGLIEHRDQPTEHHVEWMLNHLTDFYEAAYKQGQLDMREAAEECVTDLFAEMKEPYLPDIATAIRSIPIGEQK